MSAHMSAHMSLGGHMSTHACLGAHTSAHTCFGAHTSTHMSPDKIPGAHTSTNTSGHMCVFPLGAYPLLFLESLTFRKNHLVLQCGVHCKDDI